MQYQNIHNEWELGQTLKRLRQEKGITQKQLAQKAGVSRAFVIGLEQGSRPGAELSRVFRVLQALEHAVAITEEESKPSFEDALAQVLNESST